MGALAEPSPTQGRARRLSGFHSLGTGPEEGVDYWHQERLLHSSLQPLPVP